MKRVLIVIACAGLWCACGPNHGARMPVALPALDAPYELELDEDLHSQRELFDSLDTGSRDAIALRHALSQEYARRVDAALATRHFDAAFGYFRELLSLWTASEIEAANLSAFAPQARAILTNFGKSGGDIQAVTALLALCEMDRGNRERYVLEVEEIFNYGDELAISSFGSGAIRARPIEILESVVRVLPTRWAVDRLVTLYRERQEAISSSFRRKGADMDLLRAHGAGVLSTARSIVNVLVLSDRVDEAEAAIADISGIGDDATLRGHLETAMASNDAAAWVLLANMFRDGETVDQAALKLCQEAIRRVPNDPLGYIAAGDTAAQLDKVALAIRYLEKGLQLDGDDQAASSTLAALYEAKVSEFAFGDRPHAALAQLKVFESFHKAASKRFGSPLEPDLASAYAVMGRGLVSLGDLDSARSYLNRSLELRVNLRSLENLGTIELRQEHFETADEYFQRALELPAETLDDQFDHTRIKRLAAEALTGAGKSQQAQKIFLDVVRSWAHLITEYELAPAALAEALIELGKAHYLLGHRDDALKYFFRALNRSSGDNANHADLVCFLVIRDGFEAAHDVYLDAMGNREVGEYFKIYMSMWLLAESKRLGVEPDHLAEQYLKSRKGDLWTHKLARYAAGKMTRKELEAQVTTRGRRAELMYYAAVVGPESNDPATSKQLLEEVVKGSMVLFFEYELAKQRLRQLQ